MGTILSTLKKLATCLGCCECTEDNPAKSNAEAIQFICDHYKGEGSKYELYDIVLDRNLDGVVVSGRWRDTNGVHNITMR